MIEDDTSFYRGAFTSELSFRNKVGRFVWGGAYALLFRPSPRPLFGWRRFLLKCFGARLASDARIYPDAKIYAPWNLEMGRGAVLGDFVNCYNVDKVVFGPDTTVSHGAFLCTAGHDLDSPGRELVTAPVILDKGSWVFAYACILPGIRVGHGAVVAAGSVVTRDVPDYAVVAGNPAKRVRERRKIDQDVGA